MNIQQRRANAFQTLMKERDDLRNAMQSVLFVARGAPDENNRCSIVKIAQKALLGISTETTK